MVGIVPDEIGLSGTPSLFHDLLQVNVPIVAWSGLVLVETFFPYVIVLSDMHSRSREIEVTNKLQAPRYSHLKMLCIMTRHKKLCSMLSSTKVALQQQTFYFQNGGFLFFS